MAEDTSDQELAAIQSIVSALGTLDREARARVFEYIFRRFGVSGPVAVEAPTWAGGSVDAPVAPRGTSASSRTAPVDIRQLREEKQPRNAVEMAALVAYYLAELASPTEAKLTITTDDLERYFKQARFPLPSGPSRFTLTNAKNAGYLEQVDRGTFSLTPVGYNLVAHVLGSPLAEKQPTGRRRKAARSTGR